MAAIASTSRATLRCLGSVATRQAAVTAAQTATPRAATSQRRLLSSSTARKAASSSSAVVGEDDRQEVRAEAPQQPSSKKRTTLLPPTQYHPQTHGHHVATLHFSAYTPGPTAENLTFFIDFALRAAYSLGIPASQPSAAPTRVSLWTVPKSPFVHKKAQENFERRTNRRSIKLFDANEDVIERWLHLLRIYEMPGVAMRAEILRRRPIGIGRTTFEAAQSRLSELGSGSNAAPRSKGIKNKPTGAGDEAQSNASAPSEGSSAPDATPSDGSRQQQATPQQ